MAGTPRWSRQLHAGVCWRELHAGAAQLHAGAGSAGTLELHAGAGSAGGNSTLEPPSSTLAGSAGGNSTLDPPSSTLEAGSAGGNSTLEPPSSTLERGLPAGTPRWLAGTPRWSGVCWRELHAGAAQLHAEAGSAGGNSTLEPPSSTLERGLLAGTPRWSRPAPRWNLRGLLAGTPRWSRPAPRWSGVCWRELHAGAAQLHAGAGSAGGNSTLEPPSSTLELGGNSTLEPRNSTLEPDLLAGTPRWTEWNSTLERGRRSAVASVRWTCSRGRARLTLVRRLRLRRQLRKPARNRPHIGASAALSTTSATSSPPAR